jgi:hypothetical protein
MMNVKWHWLSFIVSFLFLTLSIVLAINGNYRGLLFVFVPIVILISIIQNKNNIASIIGFCFVIVSIIFVFVGILNANNLIKIGSDPLFRGFGQFGMAFYILIVAGVSYLIGLFIPEK